MNNGCVYLVGAGPGDPELLTVKGLRLIQEADVILYDGLANPALLLHAKDGCEMVSVEKRPGFQRVQQEDTNQLLVKHARAGKCVVRLKGGDPIVFGRGGEEAEVLLNEGLPFEIVPGISSAIAAPAYAGIPVTHRGISTHFTVVTGTTAALEGQHEVDWELLAKAGGTLLILMGTRNRAEIAQRLLAGGRSPESPTTAIYKGTLPVQKTTRMQLTDLATTPIENPSVIVVGPVAGMNLSWFEKRPLFGRKIAVTRARTQASDLVMRLTALGAEVYEIPTIEIVSPDTWSDVDHAIENLEKVDWVVFTSTNGVKSFFDRIFELGHDVRVLAGIKIATIGSATTEAVKRYHLHVDLEPEKRISEGLLQAFQEQVDLNNQNILIPQAANSRPILAEGLTASGATVRPVIVYKTVQPKALPKRFSDELKEEKIDLITFTSTSTITNFLDVVEDVEGVKQVKVACIGPITGQKASACGFNVVVQPQTTDVSIEGLVTEITQFFEKER